MRVTQLFRYPVKSMQGEALTEAHIEPLGIVGDRAYGVVDVASGAVLTGRREPALLLAQGCLPSDPGEAAHVVLPDGTETASDTDLTRWLGRPVTVRPAADHGAGRYEINVDQEREAGEWITWQGPDGVFHDSRRTRVSIIAEKEMRDWDVRRFRPNVVVEGDTVAHLVGHRVFIGDAVLDVVKQIDRCVMVTRPQPGGIERDLGVLRTINREHATFLGVGSMVATPGTIRLGDELVVRDQGPAASVGHP